MTFSLGLAGISASDYQFARNIDQRLVYEAIARYVAAANDSAAAAMSLFVQETTELASERYQLPGSGYLPERADGTNSPALKATGSWDVGYPISDYGGQIANTDIEMAYMTPAELERHVNNVVTAYSNTVRKAILTRLFKNTTNSYVGKSGTVTVQPLANGDSVVYPPVLGSVSEATENHYIETNYASASISDTNDPVVTIIDELEEHFGNRTGNSDILVFINQAQTAKIAGLTNFVDTPDLRVAEGTNTAVPTNLPANVPGKVLGRHRSGAWVIEWRYIPANYLLGIHAEAEKPLKMRVDPAATGLPRGLAPVYGDEGRPIETMEWRARFGFGVANRLNGVAVELGTGGSYTIPTVV